MNATTKAIFASLVVVALCLTAVGGVTYSWFSDSQESEITVTTGSLQMTTAVDEVAVQSYGGVKHVIDGPGVYQSTDLGGKVMYTVTELDQNDIIEVTITMSDGAPGDIIYLNLDNTISNSIKANYQTAYDVEEINSGLLVGEPPFTVTMTHSQTATGSQVVENYNEIYQNASPTFYENAVVKFNEDAGNEYQDRDYKITLQYQLTQGNVKPSAVATKTIPEDTPSILTVSGASNASDVKMIVVSLPEFTQEVYVTVQAVSEAPASFTVRDSALVLGGVSVNIINADGDTVVPGEETTVTMYVAGEWSANTLSIYHENDLFEGTVTYNYNEEDDITAIQITTNNFSSYYAINNAVATIGGESFNTFEKALEAYMDAPVLAPENAYTISLLADAVYIPEFASATAAGFTIDKNLIIDLNGHTLTAYRDDAAATSRALFEVNGATLTITGGTVMTQGRLVDTSRAYVDEMESSVIVDANIQLFGETIYTGATPQIINLRGLNDSATITADGAIIDVRDAEYRGEDVYTKNYSYGVTIFGQKVYNVYTSNNTFTIEGDISMDAAYSISGNVVAGDVEVIFDGVNIAIDLYIGGYGTTTIVDSQITGTIEIRSGNLVIEDSTIIYNGTGIISAKPNGNGTTTEGAAIAIATHSTNKDISVELSNVTIKNAPIGVWQHKVQYDKGVAKHSTASELAGIDTQMSEVIFVNCGADYVNCYGIMNVDNEAVTPCWDADNVTLKANYYIMIDSEGKRYVVNDGSVIPEESEVSNEIVVVAE